MNGYKAWFLASGERTWATNNMVYPTAEEAITAAKRKFDAWWGADNCAVISTAFADSGFLTTEQVNSGSIWKHN